MLRDILITRIEVPLPVEESGDRTQQSASTKD